MPGHFLLPPPPSIFMEIFLKGINRFRFHSVMWCYWKYLLWSMNKSWQARIWFIKLNCTHGLCKDPPQIVFGRHFHMWCFCFCFLVVVETVESFINKEVQMGPRHWHVRGISWFCGLWYPLSWASWVFDMHYAKLDYLSPWSLWHKLTSFCHL